MKLHSPLAGFPVAGPAEVERERVDARDISCDGSHYYFRGYRYARLGDALGYARLMRERPELTSRGHAVLARHTRALPTSDSRELMRSLGIELQVGTFRFGGFCYDRLEDAVAYARLSSGRLGARGRS